MKTIKVGFFTLILMMASASFLMTSCDKDDEEVVVVKTALEQAITDAEDLLASTEEGTAEGQYVRGSKAPFQVVVDAALLVFNNTTATQIQVDNTVIALAAATTAYNANIVSAIAPASLKGHWTFDDGTGTVLTDYSGSQFNGTLMSGADTWGGGLPTWTTDRFGNAAGALAFAMGSWVKVPYNAALNPTTMSVSVWIKSTELKGGRFLGLQSWLGYKWEIQDAGKSFFTMSATEGIYDRDTDPPLTAGTWYNLAVTFGGGNMTFYINGTETMKWDNTPGTGVSVTGHDLAIGRGSSKYAATDTNYDNDHIIPLAWGGYFTGAMDDLRIYNTVLTGAQIMSIYELEKVVVK
ncbi:MAG: LamG domain-containing protein [Bacteroidales bacterium]|nr:LamG domain-containing protein [Bacteroidales bacterium]MCF8390939.1 LamG domain-containing protein [Bacteroidales bacterium]